MRLDKKKKKTESSDVVVCNNSVRNETYERDPRLSFREFRLKFFPKHRVTGADNPVASLNEGL